MPSTSASNESPATEKKSTPEIATTEGERRPLGPAVGRLARSRLTVESISRPMPWVDMPFPAGTILNYIELVTESNGLGFL